MQWAFRRLGKKRPMIRKERVVADRDSRKIISCVLCGGDLTSLHFVCGQYILDLEREAFLSLCGEAKMMERIKHTLKSGKPLRN
jgi:hypothetical protein